MDKLIEKEMLKREEIVKNFDRNYLLEAGAGAGKTTIIVKRVINHIINREIEPQNIVAITFTKAASLELAERIQKKALEYAADEKYAYAKEKLEKVEEIFTGTIHSFCELLLREMPFEAGLTPGYKIVEDSQEFYSEIWYEFLRNFEDDYKEDIRGLKGFGIDYRDLKQAAFTAMDNPDINFVGFKESTDFKTLEKNFEDFNVSSLNPSFIKTGSNLGKLLISIIEDKKGLNNYIDQILLECGKIKEDEDLAGKFIYKKNLNEDGAEEISEFIELLLDIYKNLNAGLYNMCTDFINKVVDFKKEAYTNSLTFNDLLFRAASLIKNSEAARVHFTNKFKCFYIDEAQDTDPMQAELLLLLSHDGDIKEIDSLEHVSPRDGSLFIVGDPKQSIYRFRRADITIYETVKGVIRKRGEVVYLDINFRSTQSICSWVETSFKDREDGFAFTQKPTLIQAGFERILSLWKDKKTDEKEDKDYKEEKLSGVYSYDFAEELGIKEEEYVAAIVEDMIKNGSIDEKIGRDTIISRKIENRDIMLLTKSNEETGRYLNELKKRNISSLLAGEKRLGDTREVLNLFLLIDFITDYKDVIKFTAVLRNSFYLEFETIDYLLKSGDYQKILFHEEKIKSLDHPYLKEALFYLREMFIDSETLRPDLFIENLIKNKIGIYNPDKKYSEIEKRDAEGALVQALEILKTKKNISLYDAREELEVIIEEKVNYELPINLEFSQNAVRIMNIHKAKGLESSIVILVGRDKKRTLGGDDHYIDKDKKTEGFLVYKKSLLAQCPEQENRKQREKDFKDAELDRLIYVAATRAKSVLIAPSIEEEKMFLKPLSDNFIGNIDLETIEIKEIPSVESRRKLEERAITADLIKKMKISKAGYETKKPSSADEFKEDDGSPDLFKISKDPRGMIYGDLVHKSFELVLKNAKNLDDIKERDINFAINFSIRELLERVELDKDVLEGLYPANAFKLNDRANSLEGLEDILLDLKLHLQKNLRGVIDSFLNNEELKAIFRECKNVFTEFQFIAKIDPYKLNQKFKGEDTIINGFIDLLIQTEDDSFIIIDYKTDIVFNREIFKERYIHQLETYKVVLEDVLKEKEVKVDKLLIYSTYLKEIIPLKEAVLV